MVRTALLCHGRYLPAAIANKSTFEFSESTHKGEHQVGVGEFTTEHRALIDELHPHSFAREALDQAMQVIQVGGKPSMLSATAVSPSRAKRSKFGELSPAMSLPMAVLPCRTGIVGFWPTHASSVRGRKAAGSG
jgi:hypothetical protein